MDIKIAERIFRTSLELQKKLADLGKQLDQIDDKEERKQYYNSLRELLSILHSGFLHNIPYKNPALASIAEREILGVNKEKMSRDDLDRLKTHKQNSISAKPFSEMSLDLHSGNGLLHWFQDDLFTPEMVIIPPGEFMMGSAISEQGYHESEAPQHKVKIDYPFAVSRYCVTFREWDYYISQNNHAKVPNDEGWGRGGQPIINISWDDAKAYISWLCEKTKKPYRFLSETEWEYVAKSKTITSYWWGGQISKNQANYNEFYGQTVPVDSFEPNPWGAYNIHGNVWEWVRDEWQDNYNKSPRNSNSLETIAEKDLTYRVLRGGGWNSDAGQLRSAARNATLSRLSHKNIGLRIARCITE